MSDPSPGRTSVAEPAPAPPPKAPPLKIDLRNPGVATLLAWVLPGAGHIYQRRYAKGALFAICILGLFFYGLILGQGKVVHTGGTANVVRGGRMAQLVHRWPIIPQACVGLPALPAFLNHVRVSGGNAPLFGGWMAPPRSDEELAIWQERLNSRYDLGMLFTMVAGMLNVLAIYDAAAGPVVSAEDAPVETKPKKKG